MKQRTSDRPRRLSRWGLPLFVALGLCVTLFLSQQPATWASPAQSPLGQTVPTVLIDGAVNLQRYQPKGDSSWIVDLQVTIYPAGQSTPVSSGTVTTDALGQFYYDVLTPGDYDIHVKNLHTLSNRKANVTLVEALNVINFGTLLEGDANNDNTINTLDWSLLYSTFFGSDARTDFNQDGTVNVLDYSLLYNNFWLSGPRPVLAGPASGLSAADPVTITVSSASLYAGWTTALPIVVDTGGQQVDAAQIRLTFDPSVIQVVGADGSPATQLEAGTALGQVIMNQVDNTAGTATYAAGANFDDPPAAGEFNLAILYVKPTRAFAQGTQITIGDPLVVAGGLPFPVQVQNGLYHPGARLVLPLVMRVTGPAVASNPYGVWQRRTGAAER